MRVKSPDELLLAHLRDQAEKAGLPLDRYDPDFLMGCIITWLSDHDCVLTEIGVQKKEWVR
jgi:hypothetical protein